MASETPAAEILHFPLRFGQRVWIMAGNAAELALAAPKATAAVDLLGMASGCLAVTEIVRPHKHRQKQVQGKARPIVEELSPASQNAAFSLKMALLADGVAQGRSQPAGVNNGVLHSLIVLLGLDVQFARSMTALAADGVAAKDRQLVTVYGVRDGFHLIAMAE
jgi:hypothetical protein